MRGTPNTTRKHYWPQWLPKAIKAASPHCGRRRDVTGCVPCNSWPKRNRGPTRTSRTRRLRPAPRLARRTRGPSTTGDGAPSPSEGVPTEIRQSRNFDPYWGSHHRDRRWQVNRSVGTGHRGIRWHQGACAATNWRRSRGTNTRVSVAHWSSKEFSRTHSPSDPPICESAVSGVSLTLCLTVLIGTTAVSPDAALPMLMSR
jgi:hypothetical protein